MQGAGRGRLSMGKLVNSLIILLLCIGNADGAYADTSVTILLPHARHEPPHYMSNNEGRIYGGIEPDILQAAFASREVEFINVSLSGAITAFEDKRYDCLGPSQTQFRGKEGYYESKEIFATYHNTAITLASSEFAIESVHDLQDMSVLAFPGASKYLGDEYRNFTRYNPLYTEFEHPTRALAMLFKGRVQVLVLDEQVFRFHASVMRYDFRNGKHKVNFHGIFKPTYHTIMCTSEDLIKEFDVGKQHLAATGKLEQIIEDNLKYIGQR